MAESFYVPDGDRYLSTEITRGPWDAGSQHASPPAALLGREIERCDPREGFQIARITFEILGPVPIAPLSVEARVLRPGRRVQLLEATLSDERGPVMSARAWRIRTEEVETPDQPGRAEPPPGPEQGGAPAFFLSESIVGYHTGMEFRFITGAFLEPGPAIAWMRMRAPLVPGEEPSPLVRVLAAADCGNGISAILDPRTHLFINTDLTVQLHRLPAGEWVCLDSHTVAEPNGIGISDTTLHDETGPIGRALQSLLIGKRPESVAGG